MPDLLIGRDDEDRVRQPLLNWRGNASYPKA